MKRMIRIMLAVLLTISVLTGCAANTAAQTEPAVTLTTVTESVPTETVLLAETVEPTEPPQPTIPTLGVEAGYYFDSYQSDEYDDYMDYYVHVPEDAVENMPLVIYLHGDGEVAKPESLLTQGISDFSKWTYGETFPFVLLEPNTRVKSWNRGNIPAVLKSLIDHVIEEYHIDTERIIITGYSRGSMGVWNMISLYGDFFAAAVPVSSPHEAGHIDYINASKVAVWTFAGNVGETERSYHKYLEQNVDQIQVLGGSAQFTVLDGYDHDHACVGAFTPELFDWMMSQRRTETPVEE